MNRATKQESAPGDEGNSLSHGFDHSASRQFEELYIKHCDWMVAHATRLGVLPETAEDIVQDILSEVWCKGFAHTATAAYLSRAVHNRVLNEWRRAARARGYLADIPRDMEAGGAYADCLVLREELSESLKAAVEGLPKRAKEVFLLSRARGMTNAEIAKCLGIGLPTVAMHLTRATKALRKHLTACGLRERDT